MLWLLEVLPLADFITALLPVGKVTFCHIPCSNAKAAARSSRGLSLTPSLLQTIHYNYISLSQWSFLPGSVDSQGVRVPNPTISFWEAGLLDQVKHHANRDIPFWCSWIVSLRGAACNLVDVFTQGSLHCPLFPTVDAPAFRFPVYKSLTGTDHKFTVTLWYSRGCPCSTVMLRILEKTFLFAVIHEKEDKFLLLLIARIKHLSEKYLSTADYIL